MRRRPKSRRRTVVAARPQSIPSYYPVQTPWDTVSMAQRIAMLRDWEQRAFAYDSRVHRVEAFLVDGASLVMIVRPDGRLFEDWRPSTLAMLRCTVAEGDSRESNSYNVAARAGLEYYTPERQQRLVSEAAERALFQLRAATLAHTERALSVRFRLKIR